MSENLSGEISSRSSSKSKTRLKVAVTVVCAAVLALGAVMAILTSTDTATNKFELAENLNVQVVEAQWEAADDTDGDGVPDMAEGILPTQTIVKDPAIQNTTGVSAYIFADVTVPVRNVVTQNADGTYNEAADTQLFTYTVNEGWTLMETIESDGNITYRYAYADPIANDTTATIFDSVTYANVADDKITGDELLQLVIVNGYGVQVEGFDSIDEAYTAYFGAIYTVSFDMGSSGIAQIASTSVREGNTVNKPTGLTVEEGYEAGFYSDAACTTEFDWSQAIMSDTTVYVAKVGLPATINYVVDDMTISTIYGNTGDPLDTESALPTATRTGSDVFDAWYTKPSANPGGRLHDDTDLVYASLSGETSEDLGDIVTSYAYFNYIMPAGDTYLYAHFVNAEPTIVPFAVLTDTNALNIYKRDASEIPAVGDTYDGAVVSKVYTGEGIEDAIVPEDSGVMVADTAETLTAWEDDRGIVTSVTYKDTLQPTRLNAMFAGMSQLTSADLTNLDMSRTVSATDLFAQCSSIESIDLSNKNVSNLADVASMFFGCEKLTNLNISDWKNLTIYNINCLFYHCYVLPTESISVVNTWDVSHCISMSNVFDSCKVLTELDLSGWDVGNVKGNADNSSNYDGYGMYSMFYECNSLTTIGDVSNWNTSNVEDMSGMFYHCYVLESLDMSKWNVGNVIGFEGFCTYCYALTSVGDLSAWDTHSATTFRLMFLNCNSLTTIGDVSGWDTSKVTNMYEMFQDCTKLSCDCSAWDTSSVTNHSYFNYHSSGVIAPTW